MGRDMKSWLVAWPVVAVVWFMGSGVVHGAILGADYAALPQLFLGEDSYRDTAMANMLVAHLALAGVFTWVYGKGISGAFWLWQGLRFGLAFAVLGAAGYLIYYTVQPVPAVLAVKQAVCDGVLALLLGALTAALYNWLGGR